MNDILEELSAARRIDAQKAACAKTIDALQKIRDNLVKSENHLSAANNKLEDVTIRRLTKDAPSVRAMFEEMKEARE